MNEEQKKKLDFYCGIDNWFEGQDGNIRIDRMRINDDFAIVRIDNRSVIKAPGKIMLKTAPVNGIKTNSFEFIPTSNDSWIMQLRNGKGLMLEDWMIQDTNLDDTSLVRINRQHFYTNIVVMEDETADIIHPNDLDFLDFLWMAEEQNKLTKSVIFLNFDKINI